VLLTVRQTCVCEEVKNGKEQNWEFEGAARYPKSCLGKHEKLPRPWLPRPPDVIRDRPGSRGRSFRAHLNHPT